jgi:hypothetical protein
MVVKDEIANLILRFKTSIIDNYRSNVQYLLVLVNWIGMGKDNIFHSLVKDMPLRHFFRIRSRLLHAITETLQ